MPLNVEDEAKTYGCTTTSIEPSKWIFCYGIIGNGTASFEVLSDNFCVYLDEIIVIYCPVITVARFVHQLDENQTWVQTPPFFSESFVAHNF